MQNHLDFAPFIRYTSFVLVARSQFSLWKGKAESESLQRAHNRKPARLSTLDHSKPGAGFNVADLEKACQEQHVPANTDQLEQAIKDFTTYAKL